MTGSPMMLWFAALTPVMLVGSMWDRRRGRKREHREHEKVWSQAVTEAASRVRERQDAERRSRRAVHPDLFGLCADPVNVWRSHIHREGALTVGQGAIEIAPMIAADDSGDERVIALRAESARLEDAPVVIPLDGSVCVRGPRPVRAAVARALLLQICVVHPPSRVQVVGSDESWLATLPHRSSAPGARTVALVDGDSAEDADIVVRHLAADAVPPAGTTTVIDVPAGRDGVLTRGAVTCRVRVEGVSVPQASALALALRGRAEAETPAEAPIVRLAELPEQPRGTLGVAVGRSGADEVWLDLVDDGPHAVVVGTTGSGKSELLVTWALALARTYTPDEVMLVLADFKGGTAFDGLAGLPHVVGVITDLDGALAGRAVRSLSWEVRRREGVLATLGARDVLDPRVALPRLVVMVDEFPALVAQHPELEAVFADISARGRALGVHLILGGQRVAGAVRDATLTNCGLRVALRVSDANDSRAVIGDDAASRLSGAPAHRGTAYVRRAGDAAPQRIRVALSDDTDVAAVAARGEAPSDEPAPWLPPLPGTVSPASLGADDAIALADVPDEARREVVRLAPDARGLAIFGGPGSGKSAAARAAAATDPAAVWLSADPETAWRQLADAEEEAPSMLVCDDVDVLAGRFPEPWASEFAARLDAVLTRASATGTTLVVTAQRAAGPLGRTLSAVPRRALLALPTRLEHISLGGTAGDHDPKRRPGRAVLDGLEAQFAWLEPKTDVSPVARQRRAFAEASADVVGWVTRLSPQRVARVLQHAGLTATHLGDVPAGIDVSALRGTVIVGDPEQWQRGWHVAELLRRAGAIIVGVECASDYRVVTGDRRLPPYAGAGRAWFVTAGENAEVVAIE